MFSKSCGLSDLKKKFCALGQKVLKTAVKDLRLAKKRGKKTKTQNTHTLGVTV